MLMARPPESTLLDAARFVSRRSVHDLALETAYHVRTIQEALWGARKRPGGVVLEARPTLGVAVALARALNLSPDRPRKAGREDAAIALELLGRSRNPPAFAAGASLHPAARPVRHRSLASARVLIEQPSEAPIETRK